jgi:hypothetical protein
MFSSLLPNAGGGSPADSLRDFWLLCDVPLAPITCSARPHLCRHKSPVPYWLVPLAVTDVDIGFSNL